QNRFEIGVIATPVRVAQEVAEALVAVGARGILNFAPRKLFVPEGVALRTVDMTVEFESLSFALTRARPPRRRATKAKPTTKARAGWRESARRDPRAIQECGRRPRAARRAAAARRTADRRGNRRTSAPRRGTPASAPAPPRRARAIPRPV